MSLLVKKCFGGKLFCCALGAPRPRRAERARGKSGVRYCIQGGAKRRAEKDRVFVIICKAARSAAPENLGICDYMQGGAKRRAEKNWVFVAICKAARSAAPKKSADSEKIV